MRLTAAVTLLSLATLACPGEPAAPPPPRPERKFADVRLLAAAGDRAIVDALVVAKDELPVTFGGLSSPGVAPFRAQPVGDARAWVLENGSIRGESTHALEEGARYTLLVAGRFGATAGDPSALTSTWVRESFTAPATGQARLRFVHGASVAVVAVELGATVLAEAPALAAITDWVELTPAASTLTITGDTGVIATFSTLALEADRLFTLLLVDGPAGSPPRLAVVRESIDPATPAELVAVLDADGVVKPKARVRFLHGAGHAPAVTVEAGASVATAAAFKSLSARVEVDTDAVLTATDDEGTVLARTTLALDEDGDYTVALLRSGFNATDPLALVTWPDQRAATGSLARLGHLLGGAPGTVEMSNESGELVLPATSAGAASEYVAVPAGPFTGTLTLRIPFDPFVLELATFADVTFPADVPVTAALVGALSQDPAQTTAALLLLDDAADTVLADLAPEPTPAP